MLEILKNTFKFGWSIILLVSVMFELILTFNGSFFDLTMQKIGLLGILLTIITVGYSIKKYGDGKT
jgi:hypothetical protein